MISEIRKYIKEAIEVCSSEYKEIQNPFHKDEDLAGSRIPYQYALSFGASEKIVEYGGESVLDIPVNLRLYTQGAREKLADFDKGYENALIIKDLILDRSIINSKEYIKGVTSSTVNPFEVIDSQDIYGFETSFIFKISYGIGE